MNGDECPYTPADFPDPHASGEFDRNVVISRLELTSRPLRPSSRFLFHCSLFPSAKRAEEQAQGNDQRWYDKAALDRMDGVRSAFMIGDGQGHAGQRNSTEPDEKRDKKPAITDANTKKHVMSHTRHGMAG